MLYTLTHTMVYASYTSIKWDKKNSSNRLESRRELTFYSAQMTCGGQNTLGIITILPGFFCSLVLHVRVRVHVCVCVCVHMQASEEA